jgi:APA family basic amino acid/polyamine antiporter
LGAACIFVYRRRIPAADRPYSVPGYPWTPILFVVASTAIVLNTIFATPLEAVAGLALILSGVPVYFAWRRYAGSADL